MKNLRSPNETMSFFEHLDELRSRLIRSIIAVLVGFMVCFFFRYELWDFISDPINQSLPPGEMLAFTRLPEPFLVYMKVAFLAGLFLVAPFILCQVWLFIEPGLYSKERRFALPFIFGSSFFFILGGYFGYAWVFPVVCEFFLGQGHNLKQMVTVQEYFSLFSRTILALALVFEMPVLVGLLAKLGLVSHTFLLSKGKYAILINFVAAALITPTHDVVTLTMVAVPMTVLYYFSILVAWAFGRGKAKNTETEDSEREEG